MPIAPNELQAAARQGTPELGLVKESGSWKLMRASRLAAALLGMATLLFPALDACSTNAKVSDLNMVVHS